MKISNVLDYLINEEITKNKVNTIFNQFPELSKIGNEEQYIKYLNTIFQNSVVKDIVYHGGTLNVVDRGKDSFTGELGGMYGIYFTGSEKRAKSYIKSNRNNQDYISRSSVYQAIINIQRPLDKKIWSRWKFGLDRIGDKEFNIIKNNNSDGLIEKDFLSSITQYNTQYVVFSTKQIHILGTNEDINGFKRFVDNHLIK